MSIPIKCNCGRHMKVKNSKAGKKIRCPNCGNGVRVPVAEPTTDDQIKALRDWVKDTDKAQRDAGRATPIPTRRSGRGACSPSSLSPLTATPPPKTKAQKPKEAKVEALAAPFPWVYVAIGGGLLVVVLLVWWFVLR